MGQTIWKNVKIITSCSDDPAGSKQQGGMCIGLVISMVGCHITSGEDKTGLGCWSYVKIARKDQREVIFVTAYKPCVQSNSRDETVWGKETNP
eukprot:15288117-Ditylum_brightwellii.AAC.1